MASHGIQITSSSQTHVNARSPACPSCLRSPTANGKGQVLAEANSAHPKTSAKSRWYEMRVWKHHSLCRPQGRREVQTSDTNFRVLMLKETKSDPDMFKSTPTNSFTPKNKVLLVLSQGSHGSGFRKQAGLCRSQQSSPPWLVLLPAHPPYRCNREELPLNSVL